MFPKFSLDVLNIATLREHLPNSPRILRAGWEVYIYIRVIYALLIYLIHLYL